MRRFFPTDKKERQEIFEELKTETRTIILYEAPHRLIKTLKELLITLGDRRITLCRELTKRHETAFATTLQGALEFYDTQEPKGECVIVMEGRSRQQMQEEKQQVWAQMELSIPKREIYSKWLKNKEN